MIIFIMGMPGTGKTYVATRLASEIGATHLNSDKTRKKLGKMGQYDEETKHHVYQTMKRDMQERVKSGEDVIIDATFYRQSLREEFLKVAEQLNESYSIIQTTASDESVKQRLQQNRPDSEADYEIYQTIKTIADPLERPHLTLRTDQLSDQEMLNRIQNYLNSDD